MKYKKGDEIMLRVKIAGVNDCDCGYYSYEIENNVDDNSYKLDPEDKFLPGQKGWASDDGIKWHGAEYLNFCRDSETDTLPHRVRDEDGIILYNRYFRLDNPDAMQDELSFIESEMRRLADRHAELKKKIGEKDADTQH